MMRDTDDVHDQELRALAQRLGTPAADRLDVERTAQAVLARLRAGDQPARAPIRWMQPSWMRAAAAMLIVIGGGALVVNKINHPDEPAGRDTTVTASQSGEFPDLSSSQLRDVLAALDEPIETTPAVHAGEAGLEDLSEQQLQSLLRTMED